MNPYRRPDLTPDARSAIAEAREIHRELLRLREECDRLAVKRVAAIGRARDAGASFREVGDGLEVSGEAIRQMLKDGNHVPTRAGSRPEGERQVRRQQAGEPFPEGWVQDAVVEWEGRSWRIDQATTRATKSPDGSLWVWILERIDG